MDIRIGKQLALVISISAAIISGSVMAESVETKSLEKIIDLTPENIQWKACPSSLPPEARCTALEGNPKEAGPFTIRIKVPAGIGAPAHSHPTVERLTVISGVLKMTYGKELDKSMAKIYPAGSYLVVPANTIMLGWAHEPSVLQISGEGPWEVNYVE